MRKISTLAAVTVAVVITALHPACWACLSARNRRSSASNSRRRRFRRWRTPRSACVTRTNAAQSPCFAACPVRLTEERWADLKEVNQTVNRNIIAERNERGLAEETWLINPDRGDCNDYAVSKRHELLDRGWPARALLLSEVVTSSREHHLVLVVRTNSGDFVLDNMTPQIRPWSRAPYRWVRIQLPNKPRYWATIAGRGV
jgi:predicted transglutaminase-like cysteine proteinase